MYPMTPEQIKKHEPMNINNLYEAVPVCDVDKLPDMAEALRLLDTASNLVGNPGTNISSSTDLACDSWQEKYKKFIASLSPGVEDNQTKKQ